MSPDPTPMENPLPRGLPDEIDVQEDAPGRVRYRLPLRDLGRARFVAWIVVWASLAFACWTLGRPVMRLVNGGQTRDLIAALLWLLLTVFLVGFPLRMALLLLFGGCEVELDDSWLSARERAGLLRRSRKWPLSGLRRLQVIGLIGGDKPVESLLAAAPPLLSERQAERLKRPQAEQESAGSRETRERSTEWAQSLNALAGALYDGKRFLVVVGYPRDWLQRLADDLSARSETSHERVNRPRVQTTDPVVGIQAIVAEASDEVRQGWEPQVFDQPPGSNVQVETFPDGITLRVPPLGIWKGSAGLVQFGIIWCIGIGCFTMLFGLAGIVQGARLVGILNLLAVMSVFWAAGAAILVWARTMGKREAVLAVVADKLMVLQTGLWRSKRREWPRSQVRTVRVGPSGMEVNDVPVPELQIHDDGKRPFGMLAGRDPRELIWMATLLRQALKNEGPPDAPPTVLQKCGETELRSAAVRRIADSPARDFNYHGMTVHERLMVAGLLNDFGTVVSRQDRAAMVALLLQVQLPEAGANAYVDALLADPKQYGY
jgi:hypothetical protein